LDTCQYQHGGDGGLFHRVLFTKIIPKIYRII